MRTYCVYIMASASGVLYVGVTNNLERRVSQHQQKLVGGFTARYNVRKLVYYEPYGDIRVAIAREKQIKGWLRKRKIALIESMNPSWKDLSAKALDVFSRKEALYGLSF
jgi:putative endonuclease